MAAPVRLRALSSNTCPSSTSVTMTAAASKYTATSPDSPRKDTGKMPGNNAATIL